VFAFYLLTWHLIEPSIGTVEVRRTQGMCFVVSRGLGVGLSVWEKHSNKERKGAEEYKTKVKSVFQVQPNNILSASPFLTCLVIPVADRDATEQERGVTTLKHFSLSSPLFSFLVLLCQ